MQKILHVSDNPEHFSSIGSALAQIPANNTTPVIIEIAPGIYHEKLTINKPYITLRGMGESSAHTVISYDDYALDLMEDGSKRGTFRTYTLFIDTHDVTLQHLTIENASGDSATHGQAIALYADGDRLMIDSCRLLGHHFLPDRFPKRNDSLAVSSVQNSLPRVSMADNIIKTAISAAILILFLEAPPHILNTVP
mgnify:CR=1 FL=1